MASPPIGTLARELNRQLERPVTVVLLLAVVVGLAGPLIVLWWVSGNIDAARSNTLGAIWLAAAISIGSFTAAIAMVAFLPTLLLSRRDRTAHVVHAWVGAREVRRILGSAHAAINIPTTPEEANAWLATEPDTDRLRPIRFELLLLARRFDEARQAAARFPRQTAIDEYRIAEANALVDDQEAGDVDLLPVRAALARIPAGVDRAEATASLAVLAARRAIGSSDWRQPLVDARSSIPGRDLTILARDHGAPIFRILAARLLPSLVFFVLAVAGVVTALTLL